MTAQLSTIVGQPQEKRTAWKALELHYRKIRGLHLRDLFGSDPTRGETMIADGAGIYLDYSKNRVTYQTLKLLTKLADASGLQARIDSMFRGEKVNITERRPALHTALRSPKGSSIYVDGKNIVPLVHAVLERMSRFCERVRSGEWTGYSGKRIRNIVNVAVGGAHIGPSMAYHALQHYSERSLTFRFVTHADSTEFEEAVQGLDPSETLFVICSNDLSVPETMTDVQAARSWLMSAFEGDEKALAKHLVAVSNNVKEVSQLGIDSSNTFELWDWVVGRFSMCSAIGLSLMLAIGSANFYAMLDGFHQMDMHYLTAPFESNLPVLMGLLAIWHNNFFGAETVAILPFEPFLERFPAYLQHLVMDSNGKHVTLIGTEVTQDTSPVYWGKAGIGGHHSLYQFIHQSTRLIPCDFIAFAQPVNQLKPHHEVLIASALAQARSLAFGQTAEQLREMGTPDWLAPHRECLGNRPSNTIFVERLSPESLGKLVSLYEHAVYTQGVIWNINPFDEWGIQFGESLAQQLIPELQSTLEPNLEHDSSTNTLIRRYRALKQAA